MTRTEIQLTTAQQQALQRIDYLHLVIVSAAADPENLPYLIEHPDTDARILSHHIASLSCLMQVHLQDLATGIVNEGQNGRIADFMGLIADTRRHIKKGDDVQRTLHQHIRNIFAFETEVHRDFSKEDGRYVSAPLSSYSLGIAWMRDTLMRMERLETIAEILGRAQNSEVCTRLCFADAMNNLQLWQRDLRLIIPGTASIM